MRRIEDPEGREVEVLNKLVSFADRDVLDVGCGTGRTAHRIARDASSVVGVDPDEERIAEARARSATESARSPTFLAADVATCDFGDGTFDAVVFSRSL